MPQTPEAFTIDAQGATVSVNITDLGGNPVDVFGTENADIGDALAVPYVQNAETTTYYFPASVPPQVRSSDQPVIRSNVSATTYLVSVKFLGLEVAGDDNLPVELEARSLSRKTLVVDFGESPAELARLLSGSSPSYENLGVAVDFRVGYRRGPDGAPSDPVQADEDNAVGLIVYSAPAGDGIITVDASIDPDDGGASDQIGLFGSSMHRSQRPTIATQSGTVSITDFNALRLACIRFGLVIDGDDD